jgi:Tfp pilus assembly protein PilN
VRAVNLIPAGSAGAARAPRDSSFGTYLLLAGLAGLVAFVAIWTITNNKIDSSRAQLDRVNAEAQAAEARAEVAAPYKTFADLARDRELTVSSLSATRFDWSHGMREVSRVIPADVWLVSMNGTSGITTDAVGPDSSAAPAPRFELQGCTRSMERVARLMTRLRAIDGVRAVDLKSSTKPDSDGNEVCPANKPKDPAFTISIKFAVPGEKKAAIDSTGQLSTSAPTAAATAPAATPAASGTSTTPTSTPAKAG